MTKDVLAIAMISAFTIGQIGGIFYEAFDMIHKLTFIAKIGYLLLVVITGCRIAVVAANTYAALKTYIFQICKGVGVILNGEN